MGKTFYDLSCEELCDLMCGKPDEDYEEGDKEWEEQPVKREVEAQ